MLLMRSEQSLLFLSQARVDFSYLSSCKSFYCKTCTSSSWRLRFKTLHSSFSKNVIVKRTVPVFLCQGSISNGDSFTSPSNEFSNSHQGSGSFGENSKSGGYSASSSGADSQSNSQQDPTEEAPFGIGEAARRYNRKIRLYQLCASTDRGQMSRPEQRSEVEDLAAELESLNPNPNPLDGTKLDGSWELIYSSVPFYKTSPLLLASATPFLRIGQWRQNISLSYGELMNEVDLEAFPGLMGTIVQQTRVTPVGGERLEIVIDKTSLKGRSIADRLDLGGIQLDIPFGEILRRVQGSSSEIFLDTYYVDDELRISRTRGGRLLIFSRVR
ncbi:hypothetical protein GpartN1_g3507.t1 [Galdieria partita]|uniref:Plastid lipid-associated protein/fibrillin conserved domain-containing protein n=1 Tax=Galdieria partita TaxID=83374 RepID=A0A9C7PXK9_9RHOD|nr:hypothetical protein GpartN1_g3507.t1 [Galdieria partita]